MKTYRVTVIFEMHKTYIVQAEDAEEAASSWSEGQRHYSYLDEYPLSTTVIAVVEAPS